MANGGFLIKDIAPDATLTMTNEDANNPKEKCVNGLSNDPTFANTTSCKIRFAFGATKVISAVALAGINLADGETYNFNTYGADDWATGKLTDDMEPNWNSRKVWKLVDGVLTELDLTNIWLPVTRTKQWAEFELAGSVNPRVAEASISTADQFGTNYTWGYEEIDGANKVINENNKAITTEQYNEARAFRLMFKNVPSSERDAIFHRIRGGRNIFFVPDWDLGECYYGAVVTKSLPKKVKHSTRYDFSMVFKESAL